jgi:NAD(P)-dependent dehydrogenase (short-subunit alcohol dehydrogenase family)
MTGTLPQSLAGRVAVITGAGKGLGRAYALDFAGRGARIVVNNRRRGNDDPSSADAVVREIVGAGGGAVANTDSVEGDGAGERLLALALERFGRLDILVNNAGVPEAKTLHKQTPAEFRAVFEINFFGTLNVTLPIYRHMRESGYGRIIVSTSSAGLHGNHGMASYAASKAALIGLARTIAIEGVTHGVRCNALAPYAATAMTDAYLDEAMKRRMAPRFVAPVAAWLASESCSANGEVFVAGAGRVRRAATVEARGVVADSGGALTPELLTANDAALRELVGAVEFSNANAAFEQFLASSDAQRVG